MIQIRFRLAVTVLLGCTASAGFASEPARVNAEKMLRLGSVDERFQSFNVEMVEVTGGRFWAPYRNADTAPGKTAPDATSVPGLDPSLFRSREPIDLSSARLRGLAAALGPAYMRVSGTLWGKGVTMKGVESVLRPLLAGGVDVKGLLAKPSDSRRRFAPLGNRA